LRTLQYDDCIEKIAFAQNPPLIDSDKHTQQSFAGAAIAVGLRLLQPWRRAEDRNEARRRVREPGETIGASFMPLGRSGAVTAVAFLVADLAFPLAAAFVGAFLGCLLTLD